MKTSVIESEGLYPKTRKPDPSLRNLALGILLQAFRDIVAPKKSASKDWNLWRQDALDWFSSEEKDPGSFCWVCDVLSLSTKELREWLDLYNSSGVEQQREMSRKLTRFQIRH